MEFWGNYRQPKKKAYIQTSWFFIQYSLHVGEGTSEIFTTALLSYMSRLFNQTLYSPTPLHPICVKYYIFLSFGVSTLYVLKPLTQKKIEPIQNLKFKTFAHFWPFKRQNLRADPPPPPCRTETKYEQMFFCTDP